MHLGISVNSTYGADQRTAVHRMLQRVVAANDAGLDSLTFGDHHVQPGYVQNTPMLGRALAEWGDRPAGCLFLLPLWNPVLVAEHVSTLTGMMRGPFILQTGLGNGDRQFRAMGTTTATRGLMLDEAIRVVAALLAGDTVDSEPFGLVGASISPGPSSEIEWWVGAGGAAAALRRAARVGDVWYAPPGLTTSDAPVWLATYRNACEEFGTTPRAIVRRDVVILDDGDEACRIGDEILAGGYRGMGREQVVVGSPDEVAGELTAFAELGFEQVVIRCMAADQAVALDTIAAAGQVRTLLADA